MLSVTINNKMEVSNSGARNFQNMAVWEAGYNVCLEICRAADNLPDKENAVVQQLRGAASTIPLELSKSASFKPGRRYLMFLKNSFVSTKQLGTLLMLCHDLNYLPTEKFMDLNGKVNVFSSKLWKFIKYTERRIRQREAKN
jgi:four helix bundle protein